MSLNVEKISNRNKKHNSNNKYKKQKTDNEINNNNNRIQRIISILQKSKLSETNYNSVNVPFFQQNDIYNFNISNNSNNINEEKLPKKLNNNIKLIYKILNNPDKEIYLNEWTIMSMNNALNIYDDYCKNSQKNVFDIGYKYEGMGHITVISCDLNSHLLFLRPDGGSNGYDRKANFENLIKNGSNPYNKFYFSKWFFKIYENK
tara:strand:- start:1320 stop:1931 length:612 start_codon:yes stop_codon:yes gene_type:complete